MSNKINIKLDDGKYEYALENGTQIIKRNGEQWRDETGDNFILSMAMRIEELENELNIAVEAIEQCGVDYDEVTESLR
ncbi:putative coil containing protein [Vibrio phage 495E54-1]|nr:putative coil containing protein [Vibrio phage 495E54-1]